MKSVSNDIIVSSSVVSPQHITLVSEDGQAKVELCGTKVFVCEKCNRTFKQQKRYENHMANHPNESRYRCSVCSKTFTRYPHLRKHLLMHSDQREYLCNECGAAFVLQHHLERHKLLHSGAKPFQCDVCQKKFTRKAGLDQHKIIHTGQRPYVCSVENCHRQYSDKTTLRRHMLTHKEEKPFICKECNKTFRTKSTCRKHYLCHFKPGESFKCSICEEMFKNKKLLDEHTVVHEHNLKNGVFRCGFCLRVYQSHQALDEHVMTHEDKFIFKCDICSAKFYRNKDLQTHAHVHRKTRQNSIETEIDVVENDVEKEEIIETSKVVEVTETEQLNLPENEICENADNNLLVVMQLPPTPVTTNQIHSPLEVTNAYLDQEKLSQYLITDIKTVQPCDATETVNNSFVFSNVVEPDTTVLHGIFQTTPPLNVNILESDSNVIHGKDDLADERLLFVPSSQLTVNSNDDVDLTAFANINSIACDLEVNTRSVNNHCLETGVLSNNHLFSDE